MPPHDECGTAIASLPLITCFSAEIDAKTRVFPVDDAALTTLCVIQYTWHDLTYDKTAHIQSGKILLPMWQNAVSHPENGSLTIVSQDDRATWSFWKK